MQGLEPRRRFEPFSMKICTHIYTFEPVGSIAIYVVNRKIDICLCTARRISIIWGFVKIIIKEVKPWYQDCIGIFLLSESSEWEWQLVVLKVTINSETPVDVTDKTKIIFEYQGNANERLAQLFQENIRFCWDILPTYNLYRNAHW